MRGPFVRCLVLLAEQDASAWGLATASQRADVFERHYAFDRAVRAHGTILSGEALSGAETARTLRTVDGTRVVSDGPYAEGVQQLGGFYLIEVADLDTALELCRILPDGYAIEVRAAVDLKDLAAGDTPGG